MFTGIVEEVGRIESIREVEGKRRITIAAERTPKQLKQGDSVAVSGICLTAIEITPRTLGADLAQETWERTSLSRLSPGALVNLELPMRADGRFDGHVVQGHVDGTGKFLGLEPIPGAKDFWLKILIPAELERYVVYKGSIAIEGISLTVARVDGREVRVAIIPHTAEVTNLKSLKPGDPVNLETDIIAKYVEKMMGSAAKLDVGELVKQGF